jgi:hypothetical protein
MQHHMGVFRATNGALISKLIKNVRELKEFLQILNINN